MYVVKINGIVAHNPSLYDETKILASGTVSKKVNSADTFNFTIYPDNVCYNQIDSNSEVWVEVLKNGNSIFYGRMLKEETGWDNEKKITCEGLLALFNDSVLRPYEYQGSVLGYINYLVNQHNAQMNGTKQFIVRNVTVTDPNDNIVRSNSDYTKTITELIDKTAGSSLGGYLIVEYLNDAYYLDYLADSVQGTNQTLAFGENILDFQRSIDSESMATAIIPLGAKSDETGEYLTISSVNDGRDYIENSEAVSNRGLIFTTYRWEDVTVPANLLRKATALLSDLTRIIPKIKLSAVDLTEAGYNIDEIGFFEYVTVSDTAHDVNGQYLITERTYDLLSPENDKVTFGSDDKTISGQASRNQNSVAAVSSTVLSQARAIIDYQTELLKGGEGGYFVIGTDQDDHPSEIYFLDTNSTETARSVLRINRNGIGFSTTGFNGPYTNAWTIDGHLNASYITTGTLKDAATNGQKFSFNLETGEMYLDALDILVGGLYVGGRNLIVNTLNPVASPAANRPHILGQTSNTVGSSGVTEAEHGLRVTGATRPYIRFGAGNGSMNGLVSGQTYTFSADVSWKVLTNYTGTAKYQIRAAIYGNKTGSMATEDYVDIESDCTANKTGTAKCKFTFTPSTTTTEVYLYVYCNNTTASSYDATDYLEVANMKLEYGEVATAWSPAYEDLNGYADETAQSQIMAHDDEIYFEVSRVYEKIEDAAVINMVPSIYSREYTDGKEYVSPSGITWTVNDDGSVTAKGTASSASWYSITRSDGVITGAVPPIKIDPDKKYTISGCPSGGSASTYGLYYRLYTDDTTYGSWIRTTGPTTFGPVAGVTTISYKYIEIGLQIIANYTCPSEGVTFYPMLEPGTIAHGYISPRNGTGAIGNLAKTNKANIDLQSNKIALVVEEKNGQNVIKSASIVTAINDDSSVTINANRINLQGAVSISSLTNDAKSALLSNTSVKTQYYLSTSSSSATEGSWQDSPNSITWSEGTYVWTRVATTKTNASGTSNTTYSNEVYDKQLTTALSTAKSASTAAENAQDTANATVKEAIPIYYRSMSSTTPTLVAGETYVYVTDNIDDRWTVTPIKPKRGAYFWEAIRYTLGDGSRAYSDVRVLNSDQYASKWVSQNDIAYIDGGSIYANSVTADQIAANTITANEIKGGTLTMTNMAQETKDEIAKGQTALDNAAIVNLLPSIYLTEANNGSPITREGITWTVNNDGSVTAKGTATANSDFWLCDNVISSTTAVPLINIDPDSYYVYSHGTTGGDYATSYSMQVNTFNSSGTSLGNRAIADKGSGTFPTKLKFTSQAYVSVKLRIASGYACPSDGITFYPMMERGSIAHDYVSSRNGTAGLLTRSNFQEQLIYASKVSGTTSLAAPTSWISDTTGGQNKWTLKRPQYSKTYPVCFVATQRKNAAGTITCTTPMIDDTTTVIDGGNIITGSVTANQLAANSVTADKISVTDLSAVGATIGGWNIGSNKIYKSWSSTLTTEVAMNSPASPTTSDLAFYVSKTIGGATAYPFSVSYGGKLTATDADITGKITASDGYIGRYQITSTYLKAYGTEGDNTTCVGMGGNQAFWAGSNDSNNAPFRVSYDGDLVAKSGTIGGWTVGADSLSRATTAGVSGTASTQGEAFLQGFNSDPGPSNNAIIVRTRPWDGSAYGSWTTQFAVTYGGALTAKSGNIAGWIIKSGGFSKATAAGVSGTASTQYETWLQALNGTPTSGSNAIIVRQREWDGSAYGSWTNNFRVTYAGYVYANNAEIFGKIHATGGDISGWTIGATDFSKTATVQSGNTYTQYQIYFQANASPTGTTNAINVRTRSKEGADSSYGSWTNNFTVTYNGKMVSNNADITGKITASDGYIGRFRITSTSLYATGTEGDNSTMAGMGGNQAFWAGSNSSNSAPFKVSYSGKIIATDAEISGKITATSGSISGSLVSSGISASNITAGTLSADRLDISGLFAKNITASNFNITGGSFSVNASKGTNKLTLTDSDGAYTKIYTGMVDLKYVDNVSESVDGGRTLISGSGISFYNASGTAKGSINQNGSINGLYATSISNAYGNLANTGASLTASANSVSTSSGTAKALTSVTLPYGKWVVVGTATFPTNSSGYRKISVSTTSASVGTGFVQTTPGSTGSVQTVLTTCGIFTVTASTVVYLNTMQNSTTALSVSGSITAIRII